MSYLLRFLLFLLLTPVFLVFVFIFIPVMLLITSMTGRLAREVHVQTFTTSQSPEQASGQTPRVGSSSPDETVYDVDCTVIASTVVEGDRKKPGEGQS